MSPPTIWTIGHSTRTAEDFLALLQENGIELLVDVRRFPGSRRYPHFSSAALQQQLAQAGMEYLHMPALGGRLKPRPDSHNTAWRNESFRGYADYMETSEFQAAIAELVQQAKTARTAIMCSEAVWWRCHRSLIADYLKSHGHEVLHILAPGKIEPHPYTSAASIVDGRLSYSGEPNARQRKLKFEP